MEIATGVQRRTVGRVGGRPRALDSKQLATLRRLSDSGEYSRVEMAAMLHVSEATVYRALASK